MAPRVSTHPCFEVCGAGTVETNGLYFAVVRASYKGPTLYHMPKGNMYMFRWKREQWIVGSGSDFLETRPRSAKLYKVCRRAFINGNTRLLPSTAAC